MEIWDLYDEHGNRTGETWERSRMMAMPEGRYHLVCDILIRHGDGTFLLTASAGGAALAGETPEKAARREMREETGLEAETLKQISITRNPVTHSIVHAFLAEVNCAKDTVRLQEGETVDYQWMEPEAFLKLIGTEPVLKKQYLRYQPYLEQLEVR